MRSQVARHDAGFTLLEIMVALTVGGIALGSLYAVGSASTRHFREQQRISAAQTSLRSAMEQVKHDIQRAGFLGSPLASLAGEMCGTVAGAGVDAANQLAAVAGYRQAVTPLPTYMDPAGLNAAGGYTLDQLWLTGNYATSGEYPNIAINNNTITIPMNWQSFRRDFTQWSGASVGDCDQAAFAAAFPVGRMVRLHSLNNSFFYSRVGSANCTGNIAATVVLADAVPAACNMNGGWISPLSTLMYGVTNATDGEGGSDKRMTVLRRTEVQPGSRINALTTISGGSVPVDDRALLDYVVAFSVQFMAPQTLAAKMDYGLVGQTVVNAAPQRVRGATIDIAVRTAQHEFDFMSDVPRAAFKVYSQPGAARVRRAHAEVLMTNVANRRLF